MSMETYTPPMSAEVIDDAGEGKENAQERAELERTHRELVASILSLEEELKASQDELVRLEQTRFQSETTADPEFVARFRAVHEGWIKQLEGRQRAGRDAEQLDASADLLTRLEQVIARKPGILARHESAIALQNDMIADTLRQLDDLMAMRKAMEEGLEENQAE